MNNTVRIEAWNVKGKSKGNLTSTETVTKIVVRNELGQFHGATNFRGSAIRTV